MSMGESESDCWAEMKRHFIFEVLRKDDDHIGF